jgi:hypothetical protein
MLLDNIDHLRPPNVSREEWSSIIARTDASIREAGERERREALAQEKREVEAKRARERAVAARRQAAPEYDWSDFWSEIDHRIEAAAGAAVASHRAINTELLDRVRDAEDKLRAARHELAELRGLVAQLKEQVVEAKERAKQPGTFPPIRQWVPESVAPEGSMWAHNGAAWQARVMTASEPKDGDSWLCIAAPGAAGEDGPGLRVRGTYRVGGSYKALDLVAHDGGTWVAKIDNPGALPGSGWQIACMPGKRGPAGESIKGDPGPRGEVATGE